MRVARVNPPYSRLLPWVEKAIAESKKGKTIVLLVKHDSSTVWYAKLCEADAHFLPFSLYLHLTAHKNIKNALIYIQLEEALFNDQTDFISKVAKTEKEACALIDKDLNLYAILTDINSSGRKNEKARN